jgi:hypothetical protein
MSGKRKKLKKTHYRNPSGVSADSVAGTMRAKNEATKRQLDEAENY